MTEHVATELQFLTTQERPPYNHGTVELRCYGAIIFTVKLYIMTEIFIMLLMSRCSGHYSTNIRTI